MSLFLLSSFRHSHRKTAFSFVEGELIVLRGRFVEWLLSRPDVAPVWHRFVNHPFVLALGNGKLPLESFKKYLIQDYLYLVHFARANALASYKGKNMQDIAAVR